MSHPNHDIEHKNKLAEEKSIEKSIREREQLEQAARHEEYTQLKAALDLHINVRASNDVLRNLLQNEASHRKPLEATYRRAIRDTGMTSPGVARVYEMELNALLTWPLEKLSTYPPRGAF